MVVAKKVGKKVRKKQWFQIVSPNLFHNQVIGDIYLYDVADAVGRHVNANLMNLTRDFKRQNINIKFLISSVSDNKLQTEVSGYKMIPASIRRIVRRGKSKLEMSFVVETADRKKVRIKPIFVTRNLVKSSVSVGLRKKAEEYISRNFKKANYDSTVQEIVSHKFQSNLKKYLNKIYPLRVCEIKSMNLEKEAKAKGMSEEIIKEQISAKAEKEKEEEKKKIKEAEEKKSGTQTKSDSSRKKKVKAKEEKKETKEEKPEAIPPASGTQTKRSESDSSPSSAEEGGKEKTPKKE